MKKIYVFVCLILAISIVQAQTNARVMPAGDPNLDPNWDWTVTMPGQGHQMYYSTSSGQIVAAQAQSPFRKNGEDFFVYSESVADMYKEDGWMLVARDFGTATQAPRLPFFILYNKYRGILRAFALNVDGNINSLYQMRLGFRTTSPKPAIFTLSGADPSKRFLDNFDSSGFLRYLGVATPGGWYYGEFNLAGYDPNISANSVLQLELDGINSSSIQLNGSISMGGGITLQGIIQGKANLSGYYPSSGSNSTSFLNKGEKYFKSTFEVFEAIDKIREKKGASNFLSGQAPNGKVPIGPIIKAVGSVLGLINTFIGGNEKNFSREPISFNMDLTQDASFRGNILLEGTLNLSGNIETSLPLFRMDFAMSGANPIAEIYKPVQSIPWGVVNLKSSILMTTITSERIETGSYYSDGPNCAYVCPCGYTSGYEEQGSYYYCNCPEQYICEQVEVFYPIISRSFFHKFRLNINPNAGLSIASIKLIYQMIEYDLQFTVISPSEIEVKTPSFDWTFDSPMNSNDYYNQFDNKLFPQFISVFFKINSPIRNADDELVVIEKIQFSSEQVTYQSGGRLATMPESSFEKKAEEDTYILSFPNPTKASAKVEFSVEKDGSANLQIFDFNGKKIKTLFDNLQFKKGKYRMFWDGKDGNGQPIADGIYIGKLTIGNNSKIIRLIKRQ